MVRLIVFVFCFFQSLSVVANPEKITAIITFPAGGGTDLAMRHFEKYVLAKKNIRLVFDYRTGSETLIGSKIIANSRADGSVLGLTSVSGLAYVTAKHNLEFEYVSATRKYVTALITNDAGVKTFDDLMVNLASGTIYTFGSGATAHRIQFDQLFLKIKPKSEQIIVPYKGGAPVVVDVAGGHISFGAVPGVLVKGYIESGKVRIIAVTQPIPEYPNLVVLPRRFNDWIDASGFCIVLPKGTPLPITEFWRKIVSEYLSDPVVLSEFKDDWSEPYPFGPDFLNKLTLKIAKYL